MIAASYRLGASPPTPTSEERELALCTFRPQVLASNVTSRVWSSPIARSLPPTSEERALRSCTFKPTIKAINDRSRNLTGVSQVPKTPPQHAAPMADVGERGKEADVPLQAIRPRGGGAVKKAEKGGAVEADDAPLPPPRVSARDIHEINTLKQPPDLVKRVCDMVRMLLHKEPKVTADWGLSLKMIGTPAAFMGSLRNFDVNSLDDETLKLLDPYLRAPDMTLENARKSCNGLGSLLTWVQTVAAKQDPSALFGPQAPTARPHSAPSPAAVKSPRWRNHGGSSKRLPAGGFFKKEAEIAPVERAILKRDFKSTGLSKRQPEGGFFRVESDDAPSPPPPPLPAVFDAVADVTYSISSAGSSVKSVDIA